jgi:hypothetical protein
MIYAGRILQVVHLDGFIFVLSSQNEALDVEVHVKQILKSTDPNASWLSSIDRYKR